LGALVPLGLLFYLGLSRLLLHFGGFLIPRSPFGLLLRLLRQGELLGLLRLLGSHPLAVILYEAAGTIALFFGHPASIEPDIPQCLTGLGVVGRKGKNLLG